MSELFYVRHYVYQRIPLLLQVAQDLQFLLHLGIWSLPRSFTRQWPRLSLFELCPIVLLGIFLFEEVNHDFILLVHIKINVIVYDTLDNVILILARQRSYPVNFGQFLLKYQKMVKRCFRNNWYKTNLKLTYMFLNVDLHYKIYFYFN